MKNEMTIITKIIEGGRTGFGEAIVSAIESLEGKRAKITIEEYKRPRSNQQNRYYWGVVLKFYQSYFQRNGVNMSNDDMHIWIKEYIWKDFVDITIEKVSKYGEVSQIPFRKILTSTLLTTKEWENRMEQTRRYAAQNFSIQIPMPNEKIDQHVIDWLENPDGMYYQAEYANYFTIETPPKSAANG